MNQAARKISTVCTPCLSFQTPKAVRRYLDPKNRRYDWKTIGISTYCRWKRRWNNAVFHRNRVWPLTGHLPGCQGPREGGPFNQPTTVTAAGGFDEAWNLDSSRCLLVFSGGGGFFRGKTRFGLGKKAAGGERNRTKESDFFWELLGGPLFWKIFGCVFVVKVRFFSWKFDLWD